MRKKISIIALLILIVIFYKYKQRSFLGLSEPQIETEKTILEYAKKHNLNGEILIPKDSISYTIIKNKFNYGYLYVLNNEYELMDCNIEKLGGRCFQDIQNDICSNLRIKKRTFKNLKGKIILRTLLENTKILTQLKSNELKNYKYIYIYTWVKYAKASINENSIKFIECLGKHHQNNEYIVLLVNSDKIK